MSKRYRKLAAVIFAITALVAAAGCASKTQDAKGPAPSQTTGIIDMGKAIKNHPQYSQLERLQQEMNTLAQQLDQQAAEGNQSAADVHAAGGRSGLQQALEQEFNAKMADKQAELNKRLEAKHTEISQEMSGQMQAYAQELDKTYQPQIFSLQLKLKTIQLSKEEMDAMQKELEKLQNERSVKLSAKHQELSAQVQSRMSAEQGAMEKEMADYAQSLNAELAKRAQSAGGPAVSAQPAPSMNPADGLEKAAAAKQQELNALQDKIIKDVQDKAAQVAIERGLTEVLANARVNIQAVDITDVVIAGIKK